ncbi:MAG: hypothetical protein R2839_01760 [Thermomicrobiales bacterium]
MLGSDLAAGFVQLAIDDEAGLAWIASAQAHGHVQLCRWAGLMVLGVAIHFIPRLAGAVLSAIHVRPLCSSSWSAAFS